MLGTKWTQNAKLESQAFFMFWREEAFWWPMRGRVLVVEDNAMSAKVLMRKFRNAGFKESEVDVVGNGLDATQLVKNVVFFLQFTC